MSALLLLKNNLPTYIMVLKCNLTTGMVARITLFICLILTIIEAVGGCCSHLNAPICIFNIHNNSNTVFFLWTFPFFLFIIPSSLCILLIQPTCSL